MISHVAYKLKISTTAQIHPVFHVCQLKSFSGVLTKLAHVPPWFLDKQHNDKLIPAAILDKRMVKHQNAAQGQYLVQWQGFPPEEATWEPVAFVEQHYPQFVPL